MKIEPKVWLTVSAALLICPLFAQWSWQNPLPTGADLYTVNFPGPATGYIAGVNGVIMRTTNAGSTWSSCNTGTTRTIYSLSFTDEQTGYAVGDTGLVIKTTDGGETWYPQQITNSNLLCVFFPTGCTGYCGDNNGNIYKTTDAGITWDSINSTGWMWAWEEEMWFTSENIGYVGGCRFLYKTTDGGVTWQNIFVGDSNFCATSIFFVNPDTGFLVGCGSSCKILRTTDSGNTWQEVFSSPYFYFHSISFATPMEGCAVGEWGRVVVTHNGGQTWQETDIGENNYFGVTFSNATDGYIVAWSGIILKTTNNCSNWTPLGSGLRYDLFSVSFVTDSIGFAAGKDPESNTGVIQRTYNGGRSWLPITFNSPYYSVFALPDGTVYAGGDDIRKSTDFGNTWTVLQKPCFYPIRNLFFLNADTGFAIDHSTGIFRTKDGGVTWTPHSGVQTGTTALYFPTIQTGYAVGYNMIGYNGCIYKTTDMGEHWYPVYTIYRTLNDVWFSDENNGFVAGESLYKTKNGGLNWEEIETIWADSLFAISFPDDNTGYVIGWRWLWGPMIWRTDDAGINWNIQPFNDPNIILNDISLPDVNNGWIVGSGGNILHTSDGGITSFSRKSEKKNALKLSCYPNPAGDFINVSFYLPESSLLTMNMYNLMGQEVMELCGTFQQSGSHLVRRDISGLPAGIYFCRMIAGSGTTTAKIIIE